MFHSRFSSCMIAHNSMIILVIYISSERVDTFASFTLSYVYIS